MPSNTPNLGLYKKNPVTDGNDTFNVQTMLNENWDKIDLLGPQVAESTEALLEDQTATIPLAHGTQTITAPRTSPARVKIPGRTLVNLLGRDGNCEDISKWTPWQCSIALDSENKVFGGNGFKTTISATTGAFTKIISSIPVIETSKHYFFSGYLKNGNASGMYLQKNSTGGGAPRSSNTVTDTSQFVRVGVKIQPSDINTANIIGVYVNGSSGQYGYADGIQINEITADEYNNLTDEGLLAKYPYVDSVQHLTGAYVTNETNGSHLYVMDSLGEGEIFEDDQKNKVWQRQILDGSTNYRFSTNKTGFKWVYFSSDGVPLNAISTYGVKYDGKILRRMSNALANATTGDILDYDGVNNNLYVSINNNDSGWGDSYTPTSVEIAAYFMGWKMCLDGSGRQSLYNGTGTKSWISIYEVVYQSTSDTITLSLPTTKPPVNRRLGDYELHYKLATPVTVPAETEGSLMLNAGENQIKLGEGVVVRERIDPVWDPNVNFWTLLGYLSYARYSN